MNILLTGGTGFIGRALQPALAQEHQLWLLMRRAPGPDEVRAGKVVQTVAAVPQPLDAVINLAGENLAAARWSGARKQALRDSRIAFTAQLVEDLRQAQQSPQVWLNASAVGYYGSAPGQKLTEDSPAGKDFAASLCRDWETVAHSAQSLGASRLLVLRLGVVLGAGGALSQMRLPFSFGLGAVLGTGEQYMPWVALEDVVAVMLQALGDPQMAGVCNLVAPQAANQRQFAQALASSLRRPLLFRAPDWALKGLLGEMATVLLADQYVQPRQLTQWGYPFRHQSLAGALQAALKSTESSAPPPY